MQKIDGTTIGITRGDILSLNLSLQTEAGTAYTFQPNDKIKFSVYTKGKMDADPVLEKSITIAEATQTVTISCTNEDTKIGGYINKPVDYWYEIELNDENTVLGYDDKGPKILKLYPEGKESE